MSKRSLRADPVPFTPGPWEAITGCGSPFIYAKGPKNHPSMAGAQVRIADVRGWGWLQYLPGDGEGERMQDANARLIAAAPQLHSHLKEAIRFLEPLAKAALERNDADEGACDALEWVGYCQMALARAEGRP